MSFFWVAVKDLLLIGRDKKAFLTLILMPLLLIAILGAAFGNVFKADSSDAKIEKFTLGIVNKDSGELGEILTTEVFAKGLSEQIRVKSFPEAEMKEKIKDHKLSVGLIIPKDFSASLLAGKGSEVKLISVPNPGIKTTIVQSVIEQFTQTVTLETEAGKLAMQKALQAGMSVEEATALIQTSAQKNSQNVEDIKLITEKTVQEDTKPVGSFQYYAAAMGVMFLLMTVAEGVSAMILEKEQEVYNRLLVSRLTFGHYLSGKMLGLIVVSLIQAFVIILGTNLIFDVDWGNSILSLVVITVSFVISTCGLGVLVGSFIKREKTFNVASMLGTQIMAALGGSMVPIYIFPDWAVLAGKFLPNGLALQTYLDIMSGAGLAKIMPAVAMSLGLGLVFFVIGLIRLSIERRGKYA